MDFTGSQQQREAMVNEQIRARGIENPLLLKAMSEVPREAFVPEDMKPYAYRDSPLPIGEDQTISQPYIVAYMIDALEVREGDTVLDIGSGSGYQAAILSKMGIKVISVEVIEALASQARETLQTLEIGNVEIIVSNGFEGYPEKAPFDGIVCACAPVDPPRQLLQQIKTGKHLIIPVGRPRAQRLMKLTPLEDGRIQEEKLLPVSFVPMVQS